MDQPTPGLADAALIGVDWGSSSLRVFLVGAGGEVLAERANDQGASTLPGKEAFAGVLDALAGDWMRARPELPVLACGMVGSLHGWVDVPYATCPADLASLAAGLRASPNGAVRIVPGILCDIAGLPPDLMRGEETQIFGALHLRPELVESSCIVLPGTHSKWAHVQDGKVTRFATHMTGELFAVLRQHSVLGRLMEVGEFHEASFKAGVNAVRLHGELGLSHQIFAARSLGVTGRMRGSELADYLSGLLIGHELRAGFAWRHGNAPLALVGSPALCQRYQAALHIYSGDTAIVLDNTAPAGLLCLARAALTRKSPS